MFCRTFTTPTNTPKHPRSHLLGGGRWFEPSIAHLEKDTVRVLPGGAVVVVTLSLEGRTADWEGRKGRAEARAELSERAESTLREERDRTSESRTRLRRSSGGSGRSYRPRGPRGFGGGCSGANR